MKKINAVLENGFEWFTNRVTILLGQSITFIVALITILAWIAKDLAEKTPFHGLMNDVFIAFTFLMVFVFQKTQNKFSAVMNVKLNELVASHEKASNRIIKVEDLSEEELRKLAAHYQKLVNTTQQNKDLMSSKSIEHTIVDVEKSQNEESAKEDQTRDQKGK